MELIIKNVEYSVAKSYKTEYSTAEVEIKTYKVSKNNGVFTSEKYLEINVFGKIDNKEYPIHLVITKPVDEYLEIEMYKSIDIDESDITDSYMMIDGMADLDLTVKNLKVTRFSSSFVITMNFNVKNEFYGAIEFEAFME